MLGISKEFCSRFQARNVISRGCYVYRKFTTLASEFCVNRSEEPCGTKVTPVGIQDGVNPIIITFATSIANATQSLFLRN
ncbi:CLUMA_CG021428, isoform A [Clunio marinus]|uniref:CLUMA_CG021428, isoform A n=1 Tax=Clunio marinus TaxID=568069 RepID=A0A1J1JBT7_9DIPT|nr:CLUMA_CG021428, isoform A [Clunio marinus]